MNGFLFTALHDYMKLVLEILVKPTFYTAHYPYDKRSSVLRRDTVRRLEIETGRQIACSIYYAYTCYIQTVDRLIHLKNNCYIENSNRLLRNGRKDSTNIILNELELRIARNIPTESYLHVHSDIVVQPHEDDGIV